MNGGGTILRMLALITMPFCIDPITLTEARRVRGGCVTKGAAMFEPVEMTRLFKGPRSDRQSGDRLVSQGEGRYEAERKRESIIWSGNKG